MDAHSILDTKGASLVFTRFSVHCPICREEYDWHKGYGGQIRCCCRECHEEVQHRRHLSILGKEYKPINSGNPQSSDCGWIRHDSYDEEMLEVLRNQSRIRGGQKF